LFYLCHFRAAVAMEEAEVMMIIVAVEVVAT
jgi:predicted small metal-binding protein